MKSVSEGEFLIISYLISAAFVFLILMLLLFFVNKGLKSWVMEGGPELAYRFKKKVRVPLILLAIFLSLTIPTSFFDHETSPLGPLGAIFSVMVIIFVSWILMQSVHLIKYFVMRNYDIQESDNLMARKVITQFRVLENIIVFVIAVVALSLILMSFENIRKIGISLIASAGVAGIIIGFAAQKVIGTVLAGIQIAMAQPIRIDDVVIVEKEWGRIEEINLTYVVVNIWDKRRLVLPTTYFIENPFQNWTRTTAEILGTVFIYADYTLPVDAVRRELDNILEGNLLWDGNVKNVQVTDANEKTIEIRLLVSAADSPTAWDLRVHVREKMLLFLQEKYPQCLPKARLVFDQGNNETGTG